MSLPSNVCLECGGRGYVTYEDDRDPGKYPTQKCPDCDGRGFEVEPALDPLDWNPATDPVVRAILAMGEGER